MSTVKSISAVAAFDTIGAFKSAATSIHAGINALSIVTEKAETLRKAGIKFGKSVKTCKYRVQFADAMAAAFGGKAPKTYANYVTSFVAAVNDGAPFSLSSSKSSTKGKPAKGQKASESTGDEKMLSALLNVWKLSSVGEQVLVDIETALADGTPLIDAVAYVLEAAGIELTAEE